MKRYLPTLILVIVAAGLFAYAYRTKDKSGKETDVAGLAEVMSFPVDDAVRIEIVEYTHVKDTAGATAVSRRTALVRNKKKWRVVEPWAARANGTAVETLLYALSPLQAREEAAKKPGDLKKFGLYSPRLEARVILKDNTVLTLQVGDDNQLERGIYVKLKNKKPVYLVDNTALEPLFTTEQLVDRRIADIEYGDEVTSVSVSAKGKSAECINKKDKWQFSGRSGGGCETQQGEIVNLAASTQFQDFVPAKEWKGRLEELGLKPPRAVITIKAGPKKTITLNVGRQNMDKLTIQNAGRNEVYTVPFTFENDMMNFFKSREEIEKSRGAGMEQYQSGMEEDLGAGQ